MRQEASACWFSARLMPYRTMDDKIDGVVITFTDITVAKQLEAELRRQHGDLKASLAHRAGDTARTE